MSQDLFLGKTKRNWSREPAASNPAFALQAKAERKSAAIAKLTALKDKSDAGDKKAQKKWTKLNKKVAKLHLKASKGDLKAAKTLASLTPTGLFVTTVGPKVMKTAMRGTFVGKDEILGAFVGKDSVTKIRGNANLTEIVTSGGAFVGNDKLTEIISGAFIGADDTIPNFAKTPLFKQSVAEWVQSWNLDLERAKKGDSTSRQRVNNGLTNISRWVKLHRASKDPEDYGDNYFYWLEKMASKQVPIVQKMFSKVETETNIVGNDKLTSISRWASERRAALKRHGQRTV
jgi:hypothetical protein